MVVPARAGTITLIRSVLICCTAANVAFNSCFQVTHGAPNDEVRHVGDLGNILTDENGIAKTSFSDTVVSLYGSRSIIGRAIVVHSGVDDFGKTNHPDSLKTGNAGGRVVCGVIGVL